MIMIMMMFTRHRQLVKSESGNDQSIFGQQHNFAIMVDNEALDSVLAEPGPGLVRARDSNAYLIVIDMPWFDQARDHEWDKQDWPEPGEAGWKKILVSKVYPRPYSFVANDGWHTLENPPRIARLA
jgi:hypothetical protein